MRRADRQVTDPQEINQIIKTAKVLHLGLFDGNFPYVVPLHYGYEQENGVFVFFLHSAKDGHKLEQIQKNPHVCVELECEVSPIPGGDIPGMALRLPPSSAVGRRKSSGTKQKRSGGLPF